MLKLLIAKFWNDSTQSTVLKDQTFEYPRPEALIQSGWAELVSDDVIPEVESKPTKPSKYHGRSKALPDLE